MPAVFAHTGAPDFAPVLTKLAFHWDGAQGRLECLALAPSTAAGAGQSGVFDTNVMGAALVTAAAVPHLSASGGTAVYLSSVSASLTPPWPGLGAYGVSKAALDKLVEAWRVEHPDIGFTRYARPTARSRSGR